MKKEYAYILITYIVMQLSGIVGYPIVYKIGTAFFDVNDAAMKSLANAIWIVVSFTIALVIVLLILRKTEKHTKMDRAVPLSTGASILWAIGGVFLAFIAQSIAINIERMLGIPMGSENTKKIISIIEATPIVILVSSICGPILEEIIFRKIIFGSLYERFPFSVSALISSLIFALAHFEPIHIILYTAMGFTFAFLYVRTKRIIVPIFAHVTMNTVVVIAQSVFKDDIERLMHEADKMQGFIGGFFS
ncbi:CPBP family intramembrane glutamic endopeptidase [Falsibacillus albus]|uniref:CPBP family intramembrane metalloprotease n=1 Tax=Falsibacillus albus TaxID=2478915 RepID=A0A3L7JKB5_9BACI|nr:type II CAAX endopeptidase family protein [Falsibacillus albus]RLQ91173.1 CPBP family intramembrane metalloprotease [Falsibacillus albus]